MEDGFHPRKVGAYPYRLKGRHDEQGRRFEVHLIAQQLVERVVQLGIAALELPTEALIEVSIGKAAGHRLLKGERVGVAVSDRAGVSDQSADVEEHFLRRLLFAKVSRLPFRDELLWRHSDTSVRGAGQRPVLFRNRR